MTRSHVVMTGGVSVFGGGNPGRAWAVEHLGAHIRFSQDHPPTPVALLDEATALAAAARAPLPPVGSPTAVSAEYSMVHALRTQRGLAHPARVDLVHTGTFEGRLAAVLVSRLLEEHLEVAVTRCEVPDLDATRPDDMRNSLGQFMSRVADCLVAGHPSTTCFAPIGGYKVMTSLGYLTGAMLGYETLYVHEKGQKLIRVPAVPVLVDADTLRAVRPLYWRVKADLTPQDALTPSERALVEQHAWLFDLATVDDRVYVAPSPIADFLASHPRFRASLVRQVRVADPVWKRHDLPVLEAAVEQLLRELDGEHREDLLLHELMFKHHGTPFHAFQTATNGKYRLVWRQAAPDTVEVREVWVDSHDEYEIAVRKGDVLQDWSGKWVELPQA